MRCEIKNRSQKFILCVVAVLIFLFSFQILTFNAIAQDSVGDVGNGMRISPTRNELVIERNETKQVEITVQNVTDLDISGKVIVNDFIADEQGSSTPKIVYKPGPEYSNPYSIISFITIDEDISLKPGESKKLIANVSIKEDTPAGSYFGVVRVEPTFPESDGSNNNIGLMASVGSLILVTVPGDTVELLNIKAIEVSKKEKISRIFDTAPDNISISIKNDGNVFTKPFGKVAIKNWRGQTVHEYELNNKDPRGNVLPGSFRKFQDPAQNIGSFGRYTVEANLSYGDGGGNIVSGKTTFWVIPWKIVLLIAIALVLLGYGAYKGVRSYNKRIIAKSKRK